MDTYLLDRLDKPNPRVAIIPTAAANHQPQKAAENGVSYFNDLGANAESITVVSWGGAYTKSQVEAYHKPWSQKTGNQVVSEADIWCGSLKNVEFATRPIIFRASFFPFFRVNVFIFCDDVSLVIL